MKAPQDLLLAKHNETHPTERADLFGKRLAVCSESDDGRRLAEATLKELTGGDRVRARRMREDFWEFSPTHKIVLATNHRPEVRGSDYAVWRRIRLIPFSVTIPPERQDKTLADKLRAELSGILAWAVRGCLEWRRDGLQAPAEVMAATAQYREEEDQLGDFVADVCHVGDDVKSRLADLWAAYKRYAEATGEKPMPKRSFAQRLEDKGHYRYRNNGVWHHGICLADGRTDFQT